MYNKESNHNNVYLSKYLVCEPHSEYLFKVDYTDAPDSIPAYLAAIMMPFAYSISEGIAFGVISYTLINTFCGRAKKVSVAMWILTALFAAYYIFL